MLKVLFGSKDKELVLQYLLSKGEGYASKIARFYELKSSQIQKQLEAEKGKITYVEKVNPLNPEKTVKVPSAFFGGKEPKKMKELFSKEELEWMVEVPGEKSFAKIVVQVENEEELVAIYEKAKIAGLESHLITDSGATEFHGVPTKTAVGIGPDYSEKTDLITGNLKLR